MESDNDNDDACTQASASSLARLLRFDALQRDILMEHIEDHINHTMLLQQAPQKRKLVRDREKRPDYWDSVWGRLLQDPKVYDLKSRKAKKFRRRFRVNIYMFEEIRTLCFLNDIFEDGQTAHLHCIPLEIKVLIHSFIYLFIYLFIY